MMDIRTYLEKHSLLFDGGMGTYYAQRNRTSHRDCEWANLTAPEEVAAIHRAYLEVGCRAIKTNTYAANRLNFPESDCREMIRAGYEIACRTAGDAFVFADIGPIDPRDDTDLLEEYRFVVDVFLSLGASNFLFETMSTDTFLGEIPAYIKNKSPGAFVLVSFAAQPDGFTRDGRLISELCHTAEQIPEIDALGLNCVSGGRQMARLVEKLGEFKKPFAVMPNAGYPTVRGNRTYYDGDPGYFAAQMRLMHEWGAKILGGCCGTTPEHMEAVAAAIQQERTGLVRRPAERAEAPEETEAEDPFWLALCDPEKRPAAVELDPPEHADVTRFMDGARILRDHGAAILTVADCPVARARIDSSLMACKLRRALGMNALPHMTCRDRNLNATQALLLGLSAEGIRNVLVITGDPIPAASRDEVKSVYNFNSRKLMKYVDGLNRTVFRRPFHIYGALNINARNFDIQLEMARNKIENGAEGFMTQPVLTDTALENLKWARETLDAKLLGGIMPVVSQKNALFLNSEIAGITVSDEIIARYAGKSREEAEDLAVSLSLETAEKMKNYVDGYYVITPFGRANLVARILDKLLDL